MSKILVVEDEKTIQDVVRDYLIAAEYEVEVADDGIEGLAKFNSFQPDLVVLDINLPKKSGLEIAMTIRDKSDAAIIMLTARIEEHDQILGLKLGADDYITKPFSPRMLVARVEAVLRRQQKQSVRNEPIMSKHVTIDLDAFEATADDQLLELTQTEFNLLLEFVRNRGRVLTRQALLDKIWGEAFYGNTRVVDVYVGQVRRKLEEATGEVLLQTVRGVGYKFLDDAA